MAQTSINQLHPGVYGTISSEESTLNPASGVLTMFQADVFEKGPDNRLGFVTSVEEFISKYGTPNFTKYGQAAYNIVNFLEAGGQAYIMRVLPENASYAHAVLNVQSKVNPKGKTVKTEIGSLVKIDDVSIRPTTAFIQRNNLSLGVLADELTKDRIDENTVDGYRNNFILLVTPTGRGEAYNKLGFRISLNESFDFNYNFRVYSFEVVQFNDAENMSIVEGPFYVSFDRDAISDNRESMFIENVINRRSSYVKVEFNDKAFNEVANLINPNVNPASLDVITGQTRINTSGKLETYYDEVVNANVDVHLSLFKHNSAGETVTKGGKPVLNFAHSGDTVQAALISLDNGLRESEYILANDKVGYMKEQYPKLRSNNLSEFYLYLNSILTVGESNALTGELGSVKDSVLDESKPESIYSQYLVAKQTATSEPTEENQAHVESYIGRLSEAIKGVFLNAMVKLYAAYTLTEHNSPSPDLSTDYATHLKEVLGRLSTKDQVSIFATEHKARLFSIQESIVAYQLGTASGSYLEGMRLAASDIEDEIRYVYENLLPVIYGKYASVPEDVSNLFDENKPDSILGKFNLAASYVSDITNGIIDNSAVNRGTVFSNLNEASNQLVTVISKITFESNTDNVEKVVADVKTKLLEDAKQFVSAIKAMTKIQGTYTTDALLDNSRRQIEIESAQLSAMSSKFFNTSLVNFESPIRLLLGSDGDFTYNTRGGNNERNEAIRNHLIKAYSGNISNEILDTDLYRFNVVLDACYPTDVKKAIVDLARTIRQDFVFIADDVDDSQFTVSPQEAIEWRQGKFNIDSYYTAIFSQGLTYYDEYTGRDVTFSVPSRIASKLPMQAVQTGLHYPMAGQRHGIIDGYKGFTWMPNNAYKEKLYANRVNYLQTDGARTYIGSQSTAINSSGPLSNLNNVFTILSMKRELNDLLQSYVFELNNDETVNSLYAEANTILNNYVSNQSCEEATATVGRTDYEKQQRILRVSVKVKFTDVVERIVFSISAEK